MYEISQILDCSLDRQTLSILVSLCENGVDPKALATVVQELRKEALALKVRIFFEHQILKKCLGP